MRVTGMLVFRNCIENGYPFLETILSGLPMVDEYWLNDGGSTDGTREYMNRLAEVFPDKIRVFYIPDYRSRRWDCACDVVNRFIGEVEADWIFMGNADELIHEDDVSLYREILGHTRADVLRHPRREVVHKWSRLSEKPYWVARTSRNLPGLFMDWESYGGDEFLVRDEGGGRTWIRHPPRCKRIPVMIWHLYTIFPGNVLAKRRNDACWLATDVEYRVAIYERWREMRVRGNDYLVSEPVGGLPALARGLVGWGRYRVREELFDVDWLEDLTGLEYG